MKYLITGGAGFIGHNVTRMLTAQGHECVVLDSLTTYGFVPKEELQYLIDARLKEDRIGKILGVYPSDIRNLTEINSVFDEFIPDIVVHLASYPRQKVVEHNPVIASDVMITGLINLLEHSRRYNVKRFVYVSSSMVYGNFNSDVGESAECRPIGQYGIMKLMGERLVEDYSRRGCFEHVIVRPSAVYGEWDVEDRVVSKFMTRAIRGETLKVNGADEVLDFTYVEDTAMGITLAATKENAQGIYNVTRSDSRLWTLKNAAELVISIAGQGNLEIASRDLNFPSRGRLDITRAQKELGYNPTVDLEQGLKKYYEWYQQNPVLWDR